MARASRQATLHFLESLLPQRAPRAPLCGGADVHAGAALLRRARPRWAAQQLAAQQHVVRAVPLLLLCRPAGQGAQSAARRGPLACSALPAMLPMRLAPPGAPAQSLRASLGCGPNPAANSKLSREPHSPNNSTRLCPHAHPPSQPATRPPTCVASLTPLPPGQGWSSLAARRPRGRG